MAPNHDGTMTPMFAHRSSRGGFTDIHKSRAAVEMCGPGEVVLVLCTEDPEGAYYGWRDANRGLEIVMPTLDSLDMCFPYGCRSAEKRRQGRVVRLRVELAE